MGADSTRGLTVGSNRRNQELLGDFISHLGYEEIQADSMEELDRILDEHGTSLRFALVDITGFDQTIWRRLTHLNSLDIPVLVISPRQSAAVTRLGMEHGAHSVMAKPLVMQELAETIQGFMGSGSGDR